MDKSKLRQLRYLTLEIEMLKRQIEETKPEIITDIVKGSSKEYPYTEHPISVSGVDWDEYITKTNRLKSKLERRLHELVELREEINEFIDDIPEPDVRLIISLRFVNCMSWQQVVDEIGGGSADAYRKKVERFLKLSDMSVFSMLK